MPEDIDDPAVRVLDEEAADAPLLVLERPDDLCAGGQHGCVGRVHVIDLDAHVGGDRGGFVMRHEDELRGGVAGGRESHDPPQVHDFLESQQAVERAGFLQVVGLDVGDDTTYAHDG